MINIRGNKGITLITVVTTVVILIILTGTIIYNYNVTDETSYYNKMVSDIKLLNDKILVYYNKYEEIPKTDREITISGIQYSEIELDKLDNITLNYGNEYGETEILTNSSDVYVVDENLNIYYLKGIENQGEIYHSK